MVTTGDKFNIPRGGSLGTNYIYEITYVDHQKVVVSWIDDKIIHNDYSLSEVLDLFKMKVWVKLEKA